jgi:hypothetical protein
LREFLKDYDWTIVAVHRLAIDLAVPVIDGGTEPENN